MKVLALKDLPDGTPAGRVVEMTPEAAEILMLPGVEAVQPHDGPTTDAPKRRHYMRRDLRASY